MGTTHDLSSISIAPSGSSPAAVGAAQKIRPEGQRQVIDL
jgi:hypothetical protein